MDATETLVRGHANRWQLVWATAATAAVLAAIGLWTQARLGDRLLPHAFCISASQPLLLLHLVSDGLIAFAYLAIPWVLVTIVRKRTDIPFGWVGWVFGAFILACGVTHAMQVWTLWYPVYWYAGVAKAFTAVVSVGTAWLLYRLAPAALALPSADELRRVNEALRAEVQARAIAERQLAGAHRQLQDLLRKVEGDARTTTAVLDRFFDEAPIGLALIGADGRVVRINASLSAGTGRAPEEYLGVEVGQLEAVDVNILEALGDVRQGELRRTVQTVRGSGDEEKVLRCTLFGIPVEGGEQLTGAIVLDVTAQEQLALQRSRAIHALQEADARKDEFIAVLAHELRNPLAPIANAAEILQRAEDQGVVRMAAIVGRQTVQMARLLDDLLDVSRIVRGKMDVQLQPRDLGATAVQVAQDLQSTFEAAGTRLTVTPSPVPLPVLGDEVRLAQAVGNYLQNAAKFARGSQARLRTFADGREAVVRVEDDGPGIAPELAQRLFVPFTQGAQDLARKDGGLGLGLALTKGIVELHGGRVLVESAGPGRGAAFELRLPLRQD